MEKNEKDKSKIDELKRRLDSRSFSQEEKGEVNVKSKSISNNIKRDWSSQAGGNTGNTIPNPEDFFNNNPEDRSIRQMATRKRNFLKIFLSGSVIFFVLALATSLFVIFGGKNVISSDNIDISASGPTSISGGEDLLLNIIISNNNNTALELADLIVEYPDGTRSPQDLSTELPRERFSLGNVSSGDRVEQEIRATLFGEEGSRQKIKLTVEYRVTGSNAIFSKEKEYEIEISSSPLSFSIESLTEVNSGKEISFDITLQSNSTNLIEDVLFIAEYPFGFTFKDSIPRTSYDQDVWRIGDVAPGEERKIKITGTLEGQDGEERVFRFFSGIQSEDNPEELETAFISSSQQVFIKKPFLSLDIVIDGSTSGNYSTSVGNTVRVDILWKNNLPTSVANVEISTILSGDVDESSVFVERGFYNSINNTLTWDQSRNPVFESLNPGESGRVSFRFNSPSPANTSLLNPSVSITADVRGRRLAESNVSEEILSSASREIRFTTGLSLVPRIVYSSGPISNTGPIPPKAEQVTTYTVAWTLSNSVNDASNVVVSARLPSYVRWTGKTSPGSEDIVYNSVNREITWDIGEMKASSGSLSSLREAYFQVEFQPSLSQVGTSPVLIDNIRVDGKDNFTGAILVDSKQGLTTKISTDPIYQNGDERVSN